MLHLFLDSVILHSKSFLELKFLKRYLYMVVINHLLLRKTAIYRNFLCL